MDSLEQVTHDNDDTLEKEVGTEADRNEAMMRVPVIVHTDNLEKDIGNETDREKAVDVDQLVLVDKARELDKETNREEILFATTMEVAHHVDDNASIQTQTTQVDPKPDSGITLNQDFTNLLDSALESLGLDKEVDANSQVLPLCDKNEGATEIIDIDAVWYICTICRQAFLSQLLLTNHRVNAHGMPRFSRGAWVMSQFDLLPSIILKKGGSLETIDPDDVFSDSEDIETESAIRVKSISSLVDEHGSDNENPVIYQKPCPKSKKKVKIESTIRVKNINSLVEEHDSGNESRTTYQKPCPNSKKKVVHFNLSNENKSKDIQSRLEDVEPKTLHCYSKNCGKSFKSIKSLRQHIVAVHKKKSRISKAIFKYDNVNEKKPKLPFHTSVTKEKNSQPGQKSRPTCLICGKDFRGNHELNIHVTTHSEERPFSCKDCEKTFKNTKGLQRHRATVHERKLTWECKECPAKFGLKTELANHSLIHLGIQLFECEICHRHFSKKATLNMHQLTHIDFSEALNNLPVSFNATAKLFNNESTSSSNVVKKEVNTEMFDPRENSGEEDFYPSTNHEGYFGGILPVEVKITKTENTLSFEDVDVEVKEEVFDEGDFPEAFYNDFGNSQYSEYPPTPLPDSESEPFNLPLPSPHFESEADFDTDTEWLPSKKKRKKRFSGEIPNLVEEQSSEPIKSLRGRVITHTEPESTADDVHDSIPTLISKSNKKRRKRKRAQRTNMQPNEKPPTHLPVKCPICSKLFKRKEISKHQIEKYGGILLFECGVCFCRYLALDNLIEHEACHKEELFQEKGKSSELYKKKLAASKRNLDESKQFLLKPENEAYKCPYCSIIPKSYRYNWHITSSHFKCFECSFCGKGIKSQAFLDNHIAVHHLSERNHLCSICGKAYPSIMRLKAHQKIHATVGKFNCEHCGKVFNTKLYLTRHLAFRHIDKNDRKYKCHLCPKTFYAKPILASHVKHHNPEMKKKRNSYFRGRRKNLNLECPKCLCKFSTQNTLKRHNERIHATDDPERLKRYLSQDRRPRKPGENKNPADFTCDICGIICKYASTLRDHKALHRNERPYTCEICGKTFKRSHNLSEHKSIHKTTLDAICDVCNLPLRKKDLNKHKLQAHGSGFPCEICGKLFSTTKLLKQHSAVHLSDEDKPFQCEMCFKRFSLTQHLHQHLRNHHKITPQTRITARTQMTKLTEGPSLPVPVLTAPIPTCRISKLGYPTS